MSKKSKVQSSLTVLSSRPSLGPLEAQIMEIIWGRGEVTVRDVYNTLRSERDLAYTTVMTVMQNLHRKGLLTQRSEGQAHIYGAQQSRMEFVRSKVGEVLDMLLENFSEPALAHFMDHISQADPDKLAQLEQLIAERRAREESGSDA